MGRTPKKKADKQEEVALAALRAGVSRKGVAELTGLHYVTIGNRIRECSAWADAARQGKLAAGDIVEGTFIEVATDKEHPQRVQAAAGLAKLHRLGGFGTAEVQVNFSLAETIKAIG